VRRLKQMVFYLIDNTILGHRVRNYSASDRPEVIPLLVRYRWKSHVVALEGGIEKTGAERVQSVLKRRVLVLIWHIKLCRSWGKVCALRTLPRVDNGIRSRPASRGESGYPKQT